MKRLIPFIFLLSWLVLLCGCAQQTPPVQIAATTLPVYEFTKTLCEGTPLTVTRLVTESVSCLHDYSLNVHQVKAVEAAQVVVISGAGLEEFMEDILSGCNTIDASVGIPLLHAEEESEHEGHEDHDHEDHHHEDDPHVWLSPANAKTMVQNISEGLGLQYPQYRDLFLSNSGSLLLKLSRLEQYGAEALSQLSCRDLVTFHDGFGYLAQAFDLNILKAVEEESGSEASAQELISMISLVQEHHLPAIFTERSGSTAAASIIARETGAVTASLDMAMAGDSYFDAMYHNINTLKEVLQ